MYFILFYTTVTDYIEKRAPYRAEHLALAKKAEERGELVLAGALDDPADQAVLVFYGDRSVAEQFAQNDPYVQNGIVSFWTIRPWNVVVGSKI